MDSSHFPGKVTAQWMIALCLMLLVGCDAKTQRAIESASSKADAYLSNLSGNHDSRLVGGELNYGYTVTFTVTNIGQAGIVRVSPWLTCSEGEWSRVQHLHMASGKSLNLSYFFDEPTINSSNIQFGVRLSP